MKIVVLAKEVPDTYGQRTLNLETGLAERDSSDKVMDEVSERALEVAISYASEHPGTEVVLLGAGPESAAVTLRKGLAAGADSAVHVLDAGLLGADTVLTAQVLAAAVARGHYDLVIAGNSSTDGGAGVVHAMIAEILELPQLTNLNSVAITDAEVSGERAIDGGTVQASASLPAVISVTEQLPDLRFANFKGIMAAKKKPLETLTLEELAVEPNDPEAARSIMIAAGERPARTSGTVIIDEGDAGEQLAAFLVQNRLA